MKEEEIKRIAKTLPELEAKISSSIYSTSLATLWNSLDPDDSATLAKNDVLLIPRWYLLDTNAVPPVYILQTITTFIPDFRSNDNAARNAAGGRWWKIFEELTRLLRIGASALLEGEQEKYFMSVTEAEVHNGILNNKECNHQSFCSRRQITNATNFPASIPARPKFVDITPEKTVDIDAHTFLEDLKMKKVPQVLQQTNIMDFTVSADLIALENLPEATLKEREAYLQQFLDSTCDQITQAIFSGYAKTHVTLSPLISELIQQYNFCLKKRTNISVSETLRSSVMSYLTSSRETPHVVWGESGSGKTSLVAALLQHFKDQYPDAMVIYRFVGITPASSTVRQLLQSVYSQIVELLRISNKDSDVDEDLLKVPSELKQLNENFPKLLAQRKNLPLFIFLDSLDQLSQEDDGLALRWVPWQLPENVHLVISVLPMLLDTVKGFHHGGDECFTNVPRMNPSDGLLMLQNWLAVEKRSLTPRQQEIAMDAFRKCPLPLYLRVATDIMLKWPSYLPESSAKLEEDLPRLISESILDRLELIHGEKLVSHALGYITAAKDGLSSSELEGILSCDEDVLKDVYQWWTPPTRVLPPMLWKRIRDALGGYLVEHGSSNALVYRWYHRQFWEAAERRYLRVDLQEVPSHPISNGVNSFTQKEARHLALAKFFNGDWSSPKLVPYIEKSGKPAESDRLIRSQPLQFSAAVYNLRKLRELPYHQALAFIPGHFDSTLYNFEFISAKFATNLHFDLLHDYALALEHVTAEKYPEEHQRLLDYQSFIHKNMHILVDHPDMALQLAFNGPDSQLVTKDAQRQAVPLRKPMFQWINKSQNADPCLKTITLPNAITFFDVSPDGTTLAVSYYGNEIKIFSLATGAQIGNLGGQEDSISMGRFFPDGKKFLSGAFVQGMKIWDVKSGKVLLAFNGHAAALTASDISPDGKIIITCSDDMTIKVRDAETATCIATLDEHKEKVRGCKFSPLGDVFATTDPGCIVVWRASDYTVLYRFDHEAYDPNRIAFSQDGRYLISTTPQKSVVVFDVKTGEKQVPIPGQGTSRVGYWNIAHKGDKLALSWDSRIEIFNTVTFQRIAVINGHSYHVTGLKFTQDGKYLISGSGDTTIKIWDASYVDEENDKETEFTSNFYFSPDGTTAVTISSQTGSHDVCKILSTTKFDNTTQLSFVPNMVMFCPDGNLLVTTDEHLRIVDLAGNVISEFSLPDPDVEIVAMNISKDGNVLAVVTQNRKLTVFNVRSREVIGTIEGTFPIRSCALSPTGDKIVTGAFDGSTTVWEATPPNSQLLVLQGHYDFPFAVIFSTDGQLVASASTQCTLFIWDANSGEQLYSFAESVIFLKFIGPRTFYLIGESDVCLFDLTQSPPCVARYIHGWAERFVTGDIHGNRVVAFDLSGRMYDLLLRLN
eukprot:Phypoly_transcript_00621.p1 GENE.Phypoly_transcript_00621~~Phypoly_transcript_00621.p1  ORF type:complete len:1433 (-),score=188.40 Phypoly_transcript_00621:46-4263(-)